MVFTKILKTLSPIFMGASLFLVIALVGLAVFGCSPPTTTTPVSPKATAITPSGQSVKLLSDDSGQYQPREIKVKLGSVVKIEGDIETLVGGMDTVVIDGYGIRKIIAPNDNLIEFTANKPGTFEMICANGMGNGKLIVEP